MLGLFLSRRERLRRTASAWMARLDDDSPAEVRDAFQNWYEADPEHAAMFDKLRWNHAMIGMADRTKLGEDPRTRISTQSPRNTSPVWRPAYFLAGAVAALVAVVGLVVLLGSAPEAGAVQQRILLSTQPGEVRTVPLADGTRVTLDGTTVVNVVLGADSRDLELRQGRIRVEVAADLRPLYVSSGATRIALASGSVDVGLGDGGTTVQLLPGAGHVELVREGGAAAALPLQAGQIMTIPQGGQNASTAASSRNDIQWPTGRLEFDRASVAAVIAEANRYATTQIRIEGDDVAALQVTGVFMAGDTERLARRLALAFDLQVEHRQGAIILRSAAGISRPQRQ